AVNWPFCSDTGIDGALGDRGNSPGQDRPKIEIVPQISHSGYIMAATFSPDGKQVLSGSVDHTIKLCDVASGSLVRTFRGHSNVPQIPRSGWVLGVEFSPDGSQVLSGSTDHTGKLWDMALEVIVWPTSVHDSWL